MTNFITNEIKAKFNNHNGKYYALMLFETEINLGISNIPNKWKNINNLFFNNGLQALEAYSNVPNPASQLIDATSLEELNVEMNIMADNYNNPQWLNDNLYPYL